MAGDKKKLNYSKQYHIRVKKETFDKLKKLGSKEVRTHLEKI